MRFSCLPCVFRDKFFVVNLSEKFKFIEKQLGATTEDAEQWITNKLRRGSERIIFIYFEQN